MSAAWSFKKVYNPIVPMIKKFQHRGLAHLRLGDKVYSRGYGALEFFGAVTGIEDGPHRPNSGACFWVTTKCFPASYLYGDLLIVPTRGVPKEVREIIKLNREQNLACVREFRNTDYQVFTVINLDTGGSLLRRIEDVQEATLCFEKGYGWCEGKPGVVASSTETTVDKQNIQWPKKGEIARYQ